MTGLKNSGDSEKFASRWSRRKRQAKLELEKDQPDAAEIVDEVTAEKERAEQDLSEKQAALNALKDEDMPDISTLDENSDFSQFMSTNVSEALRKLALRKLFQGKTYNLRDGLDEYDGDYTSFEKLDPGTITADMKYRQELEAEKRKAQLEKERIEKLEAERGSDPEIVEDQEAAAEPQDEQDRISAEDLGDDESGNKAAASQGSDETAPVADRPRNEPTANTNEEETI